MRITAIITAVLITTLFSGCISAGVYKSAKQDVIMRKAIEQNDGNTNKGYVAEHGDSWFSAEAHEVDVYSSTRIWRHNPHYQSA